MKKTNLKWSVLGIVILSTFYVYSIKEIAIRGYSISESMILRGFVSLLIGIVVSKFYRVNLVPQNKKIQFFRFFSSGFTSYFYTASFAFLNASTIALLCRLDIPFLLILATLFTNQENQKKSNLQFWLSIWTIIIVSYIVMSGSFKNEVTTGYVYVFVSIILIALGSMFIKNSAKNESIFVFNNVFSLSNFLFGLVLWFAYEENFYFNIRDLWIFVLFAFSQLGTYIISIKLYKLYDVERARLPFVVATIAIYFFEILLGKREFDTKHLLLTIIITGMIITIILNPKTIETKHNFLDKT